MSQQVNENIAASKRAGATGAGPAPLGSKNAGERLGVFAAIAVAWVVLDQVVKAALNTACSGTVLSGPIAGLFRLLLVHNTGGAWSMFAGATVALGVFSLVMCACLTAFLVVQRKVVSWPEVVGLALVVGGGIGNAIDRFVLGYVVDFIDLAFMNFPVFNIADIGVTCGLVLFLVAWLVRERKAGATAGEER
ncbi:signal peptidase II [Senegalimassilia faecalis]|uniref:signal peptidase II n=1 Tax=Senegalimassilia faecalis TaxID=2509433 RepID=UPI00191C21DA|nr:signal peptidase II [Senegalimassilia faecalis]